jgi:hypothetical protein
MQKLEARCGKDKKTTFILEGDRLSGLTTDGDPTTYKGFKAICKGIAGRLNDGRRTGAAACNGPACRILSFSGTIKYGQGHKQEMDISNRELRIWQPHSAGHDNSKVPCPGCLQAKAAGGNPSSQVESKGYHGVRFVKGLGAWVYVVYRKMLCKGWCSPQLRATSDKRGAGYFSI